MNNELLNQDIEKAKVFAAASNSIQQEQLHMNQLLGRIQATQSIAATLDALSLVQIAEIKENKSYQQFAGQSIEIDGKSVRLDTWDGFCQSLGSSRSAIDEKLDNLRLLGESAYEKANELGMSMRQLRKLRKMPSDDQKMVIGEIEAAVGDKDAIVELIETMSAKHNNEKANLEKELSDQRAEAKASSRIIEDKNNKITELERQIFKQETRTLDEQTQDEILALDKAMIECLRPLPGLSDAIATLIERDDAALTLRAADALRELKTAIEQLQIKHALENVEVPDDSWMAAIPEDAEEQPLR